MQFQTTARRYCERRHTSAPGQITWYTEFGDAEERAVLLVDLSRVGVRVVVEEKLEKGQPVFLTIPMPLALRGFDKRSTSYHVWGVIRFVAMNQSADGMVRGYQLGIALIGDSEPTGYFGDLRKRYELKPFPSKEGFWQTREIIQIGGR